MSIKISDICDINSSNISSKDNYEFINYLDTSNLTEGVIDTLQKLVVGEDKIPSRAKRKVKKNDVLISTVRPNQKHYGILRKLKENLIVSTGFVVLSAKEDIVDAEYLYRYLTQDSITNYLQAIGETSTSAYPSIKPSDIGSLEIELPQLEEQKAIAKVLLDLDQKIEINNKINKKLEEMAQAIFKQWFVDFEFPNEDGKPYKSSGGEMNESEQGMIPKGWLVNNLGDLINIVDNRGKTPPQEKEKTEYPIIDVKALSGDSRVIDYNNCLKFVSKSTYENWFRSGHPADGDILMSTVGSLAELKIFYGNVGCIAQNVVALRSKGISNLYLYQYLKYIKNTLVSYNIGSVQPSIKITHVIKHKILIPNEEIINKYHNNLYSISQIIFNNSAENEKLISLRDTLLPKLMSGEIRGQID